MKSWSKKSEHRTTASSRSMPCKCEPVPLCGPPPPDLSPADSVLRPAFVRANRLTLVFRDTFVYRGQDLTDAVAKVDPDWFVQNTAGLDWDSIALVVRSPPLFLRCFA